MKKIYLLSTLLLSLSSSSIVQCSEKTEEIIIDMSFINIGDNESVIPQNTINPEAETAPLSNSFTANIATSTNVTEEILISDSSWHKTIAKGTLIGVCGIGLVYAFNKRFREKINTTLENIKKRFTTKKEDAQSSPEAKTV